MDTQLLEFFLQVAETGSINKAAMRLDMPQPTLSRYIAALEHEMKCTLFTRTQGGVKLTDAGRLLSDRSRPFLRQLSILKEQVGEQAAGHLSIGMPPAWQHVLTGPFVERMANEQRRISVRIYEGLSNVLKEYMSAGLLDIGIVPWEPALPPAYTQLQLLREPVVIVGHRDEGLRSGTPISLARLATLRLVLPGRPNFLRMQLERAMDKQGLHGVISAESDALSLNLELARRGVGVTAVPASSLSGLALDEQMSWAPLRGHHVVWALCENVARGHSPSVREGLRHLRQALAKVVGTPQWPGSASLDPELQDSR